ncbi:two-component system, NtrC family, response regulator [Candidatus Methanophagaceae archaeon]|nr:two-component system, NtrC family, response regulator [Methanophagales archaeon]
MSEIKQKKSILVVDDDPNMIKLIQFYLLKDDFEITPCTRGKDALKILKKDNFEVILIDMLMPEMDGHTLLKKMKEELKIETPIVVVTAHGASDNLMKMIDDGAYDILQKPFSTNRLKLTLRNALIHKNLVEKCRVLELHLPKD